jgi:hypothetical protein
MLINELRHAVAAQKHRKIIKPRYNALKFDPFDQKHGHRCFRFSEGVQKEVLKSVIFFSHYECPIIFIVKLYQTEGPSNSRVKKQLYRYTNDIDSAIVLKRLPHR